MKFPSSLDETPEAASGVHQQRTHFLLSDHHSERHRQCQSYNRWYLSKVLRVVHFLWSLPQYLPQCLLAHLIKVWIRKIGQEI